MQGLGSPRANQLAEAWLPSALLALIHKLAIGHYPTWLSRSFELPLLGRMQEYLD